MSETVEQTQPVYSIYGDDPDLGELVGMFVDEMPGRVDGMLDQFNLENWAELGRIAHQLKGAAGSYGFEQITPLAARLERAARQDPQRENIRICLEALVSMCHRLRSGGEPRDADY